MEALVEVFDFEGLIDMDILKKGDEFFINEVNPRFGGVYPSAIACGKDFFRRYLNDDKNGNFQDYELHLKTVKYENTIIANRTSQRSYIKEKL